MNEGEIWRHPHEEKKSRFSAEKKSRKSRTVKLDADALNKEDENGRSVKRNEAKKLRLTKPRPWQGNSFEGKQFFAAENAHGYFHVS